MPTEQKEIDILIQKVKRAKEHTIKARERIIKTVCLYMSDKNAESAKRVIERLSPYSLGEASVLLATIEEKMGNKKQELENCVIYEKKEKRQGV